MSIWTPLDDQKVPVSSHLSLLTTLAMQSINSMATTGMAALSKSVRIAMQVVDQAWASVVVVAMVAATACEAVTAAAEVALGVVEDMEVAATGEEAMEEVVVVVMAADQVVVVMVAADQVVLLRSPQRLILSPTMPPMEGRKVRSSMSET